MGKPILITVFILGLAAMLPNQALAKADPTLDQTGAMYVALATNMVVGTFNGGIELGRQDAEVSEPLSQAATCAQNEGGPFPAAGCTSFDSAKIALAKLPHAQLTSGGDQSNGGTSVEGNE